MEWSGHICKKNLINYILLYLTREEYIKQFLEKFSAILEATLKYDISFVVILVGFGTNDIYLLLPV